MRVDAPGAAETRGSAARPSTAGESGPVPGRDAGRDAAAPTAAALLRLVGRGSNGRGVLFNLAGAAAPAVLALLAVPRIAGALGTERFGILTLAWTAIGYAVFLHLGLGRAVMRDAAAPGGGPALAASVWTASLLTFSLGAAGGALLFAFAPAIVRAMHVAAPLRAEAAAAFRVLACAVPFTVTTPVLSAVLEARRRFDLVNAVTVPGAAATYLGPVAALAFTRGLVPLVTVLAVARVASCGAFLVLALREAPALRRRPRFERSMAGPLLAFGGWTTVSAVVSPLLESFDRFAIGAIVSSSAVAYYATGQEAVLRMGMVSGAVVGVLFPAVAAVPAGDGKRLAELLEATVDAAALLVLPLTLLLGAFAGELLRAWMGATYAAQGERVLAWLSVGLLINGLAKMPSTLLQAEGRPDLTAKLHLLELPAFVALLCALVWRWGIDGAAAAWVARVAADGAALFWVCARRTPETRSVALRALAISAAGALAVAGLRVLDGPGPRAAALAVVAIPFALGARELLHRRARRGDALASA